jgi:hypothetical protein
VSGKGIDLDAVHSYYKLNEMISMINKDLFEKAGNTN